MHCIISKLLGFTIRMCSINLIEQTGFVVFWNHSISVLCDVFIFISVCETVTAWVDFKLNIGAVLYLSIHDRSNSTFTILCKYFGQTILWKPNFVKLTGDQSVSQGRAVLKSCSCSFEIFAH